MSAEDEATIKAMDTAVTTTVGGSIILNFIVNLVIGGALGKMWEMINTLQIIYFMPLIEAGYTALLKKSLKIMDIVNGDVAIPGSDYLLNRIVDVNELEDFSYRKNFEDFGIEGTTFVVEYKDKMSLWVMILSIYPIVALLKWMLKGQFMQRVLYKADC